MHICLGSVSHIKIQELKNCAKSIKSLEYQYW
jgi:hypothetical protein